MQLDPIIIRARDAIKAVFGARLDRLVLFGSRARGDAQPDADYDIAVFLKQITSFAEDRGRVIPVAVDLLYSDLANIHPIIFAADAYDKPLSLMDNIRREGIPL